MENITKAILAVMEDVKGIEKTLDVGYGNSSYKGVSDKVVKEVLRPSMINHGLIVVPVDIDESSEVYQWEETYNNNTKRKQQVFTKVTTKYKLLHTSGESIEFSGYGQGVDTQDKGAGKASTYALKYALLYLFLIPTGKILDSDNDHSDTHEVPEFQTSLKTPTPTIGGFMPNSMFKATLKRFNEGEYDVFDRAMSKGYKFTDEQMKSIEIVKQRKQRS